MKIGILTFHNAYNFGAVLQAYALQSFLENKNCDVEIIDYRNEQVELSYRLFHFRSMPKENLLKCVSFWLNQIWRWLKYSKFRASVSSLLKVSNRVCSFDDYVFSEKDIIIIGSDQLWNKKITRIFDPYYWGEFANKIKGKVITYAICMNTENLSSNDLQFIKNHLENFASLSVREMDLYKILAPLTSKHIYVSLDPTLMVDSTMWRNLMMDVKAPFRKKYLLVYAILERKKVVEKAREFAMANNLKMVVMSPIASVMPFRGLYQPTSPVQFLSAFAHAEFVITSSFHGLAFSLIFQRDMYVMGDSGRNERMISLLTSLGIENRFIHDVESIDLPRIDFTKVERRLKVLRYESQNYLLNAINDNL